MKKIILLSLLFYLFISVSPAQSRHGNTLRIRKKTDIAVVELTPNGDGVNDVFNFSGKNLRGIRAEILDSKGKIIYECGSVGGKWSGKLKNGEKAAAGIYYYKMLAEASDGNIYERKGTIKLFKRIIYRYFIFCVQ